MRLDFIPLLLFLELVSYSTSSFVEFDQKLNEIASTFALNSNNQDFLKGLDSPKEIEIVCLGESKVNIRDIISDAANGYQGDCTIIKMKGENFNFEFTLNCNEDE